MEDPLEAPADLVPARTATSHTDMCTSARAAAPMGATRRTHTRRPIRAPPRSRHRPARASRALIGHRAGLNHVSGPAAASSVTKPVVHRGGRGAGSAVWNHLVGSSEEKIDHDLVRRQRRLLIVHGGQPPSLLLECCGEHRAR